MTSICTNLELKATFDTCQQDGNTFTEGSDHLSVTTVSPGKELQSVAAALIYKPS